MADISVFIRSYSSFQSTFRKTSFDDAHSISLCADERQEVIDYDRIIEEKYPNSNMRPKSFDALYVKDSDIYCIEFKNQKPSDIGNTEIKEKLEEGKRELDGLLSTLNIQKNNYNFIYCVCYKDCVEPRDRYKCGVAKGAIQFDLKQYKEQNIVKEVFTNNVAFFTKQFQKKTKQVLNCL
ncbi:hypothetical protein JWV37_05620 [Sulfurospirillum sp. T05]|uniref:Uncharacterized protein n=1 Tax=Sulfurospirillum tamanense TaxID=2813362 RepID=A0ABS2WRG1_9BACT|nr:hypothetical protein [Sulfurospirillum tamanensis]MBN2964248.1 hypothetical protein [Sulfurospirillum tamanensis]